MKRWCYWAINGIPMPIPQSHDIFPSCTPRKIMCSGQTWVIPAYRRGVDKDRPICESHMKESQMYHAGYLRATNTHAPELPDEEWREFTKYGHRLEWEIK